MARDFAKGFYNSKEWQRVRDYCLKRDRYMCVECGIRPAEEVHHIKHLTPENITDVSVSLNPENLKSLCRSCHFQEHKGEHAGGRAKKSETQQYTFDENGMLVPVTENNFG